MFKLLAAAAVLSLIFAGSAEAAICPSYPYTFSNGSTADATQVNSNFSSILNCANSSLAPISGPIFSGNVGIGTGSPQAPLQIGVDFDFNSNTPSLDMNLTYNGGWKYLTSNYATLIFQDDVNGGLNISTAPSGSSGALASLNYAALFVRSNGNVGIGTAAPSYPLYVNGTAYASGATGALSDIRHKDKVATLASGALNIVGMLRPVTFVWKNPTDDGMKGEQIGFIAQEVEAVLPSVVLVEDNKEKTMGIKYDEIIPVLAKAIQEQQAEIQELRATVAALKSSK